MKLMKLRTALILLLFLGIGFVFFFITTSFNVLFSWILIGLWIIYTIKFFQKIKEFRGYNSPQNTSFFIFTPLLIGVLYSIWSRFADVPFLSENLFEGGLFISWWNIIFSFPYLIYGLISLYRCYRKYYVVYLIRTRSLNARKFAYFYTILILVLIVYYWVSWRLQIRTELEQFFITPLHLLLDLTILITFIVTIIILIFPGFIVWALGSPRSVPEVSSDYIARRRRQLEGITSTPGRPAAPRANTPTPSRSTASRPATPRVSRPTAARTSRPTTSRPATTRPATPAVARPTAPRQRAVARPSYEKLMPKAGILSLEDFKCIFCFELPKLPSDERRGVIICPNCRFPAHADEFKGWAKASPLCSRCDAPIPPSFLRNPKVIPVKVYIEVIKEYKRKG